MATLRLQLEPLMGEHANVLFDGLRRPEIYEFIPDEPPSDLEALRQRFAHLERRISPDCDELWLNWAIKRNDGVYLGYAQATVFSDGTAALAYVIFPQYWRNGFGREACDRVVQYIFDDSLAALVTANCDSDNLASQALLKSIGFQIVGYVENTASIRGRQSDEVVYHRTKAR
ncbi:MAG: GNAT family N-acetyltransferase [Opitutaceae bacterium]